MLYTRDINNNIMTRIPGPAAQVMGLLCDMDVLLPTLALDFDAARTYRDTARDLRWQIMIIIMELQTPALINGVQDTIIPILVYLKAKLEELEDRIRSEQELERDIYDHGWIEASRMGDGRKKLRNSITRTINGFYSYTWDFIRSTGGFFRVEGGSIVT
ncbi:hypothetical protein EIK77_007820 [Talaromyces pinophilus]|nr:hypothetical protein EIK77_007820 [Talaromyces pinophilus]